MGWNEVEQAFAEAAERQAIPGATIVVRKAGEVAFEGAFGQRTLQPERSPMRLETVFDLSSLTKPLATTVAVMMLVRDAKLKLDDRVTRFFHNFGVLGKTYVTSPSQIPYTQAPSAPSSMQMPTPKAPAQSMPCGQQCWNTYKKYLGWGGGVAGGASAAGSCALACSPLLFGGPQAYGACLARCGIMGGGAIAACAAATTLWYRQCESACNGK